MLVGVPKEIKNNENRVAMTPAGVQELTSRGNSVLIETAAGVGSGFSDAEYVRAGAEIAKDADSVWSRAELIVKVKEPIASEYPRMRQGQVLFTYLHLAASRNCTDAIVKSGTTAIAYETVQIGRALPLLHPMSEVAGRLSAQIGANQLMKTSGGPGILMGGVPGTPRAKTVVIGGGVAGTEAARVAHGMGAEVVVIDLSLPRLQEIENMFDGKVQTRVSTAHEIAHQLSDADLIIGSVLIPGAKAPKLVTDAMVRNMKSGSVLVDIAIDQGGCFEHSRPTTHDDPTFAVHHTTYYCVANMPGAVPATSTVALTNATLPYVLAIAAKGWKKALQSDPALALGLNAQEGVITHPAVHHAFPEMSFRGTEEVISAS